MNPPPSPLDTLRQLKEMLDAGTLTPAEFEELKQKLIFGEAPAAAEAPLAAGPLAPPVVPAPVSLAELADEVLTDATAPTSSPVPEAAEAAPPRNYLNLVLAVGGLLALLALLLYLNMGTRPSEHIGSTSLTAADSTQAVEEGPQAIQPTAAPTVPETVRTVVQHPLPAAPAPAEPLDSTGAYPQDDSL